MNTENGDREKGKSREEFDAMIETMLHDLGVDEKEIESAKERAANPPQEGEPPREVPAFIPTASLEESIEKLDEELLEAGEPNLPLTRETEAEASADAEELGQGAQNAVQAEEAEPIAAQPEETKEQDPFEEPAQEPAETEEIKDISEEENPAPIAAETQDLQAPAEEKAAQENAALPQASAAEAQIVKSNRRKRKHKEIEEEKASKDGESFEISDLLKAAEMSDPEKKSGRGVRILFDWLEEIVLAVVIVVVVFSFLFRVVTVQGTSMEKNFSQGDKLIVSSFLYKIEQGDVVVAVDVLEDPIIKRVIATEGQTVYIDNETGCVYVDGQKLDETAYTSNGITFSRGLDKLEFPAVVPENCVFLLGDNRLVSKDSRYSQVGMVSLEHLLGKVELQIYPFSEIRLIR